MEVPDVRRQGTEYGRHQVGWVVCGNAKVVLAVGCLGNPSAARGFGIPLFWRRAALPVTGQGPRAMPSVPAAMGYLS